MSEERFTPGPWLIDPYRPGTFYIGGRGVDILAEVPALDTDDSPLPAEANARLIAAAPELYEALSQISAHGCGCHPKCQCDEPGALAIWKEEAQSRARAALSRVHGDAQGGGE